ncbi:MAG: hypothetical protein ACK2UK_04435 [Candidatus Promineifilaceae bacterium]
MIQAQTQRKEYWEKDFSLNDSDVEQLYNHFLETEKPQTVEQLAAVVMAHRVSQELRSLERTMKGRQIYQPQNNYEIGAELVFPALRFAEGTVTGVRPGFNPQEGSFQVVAVDMKGRTREFVADYQKPHLLSTDESISLVDLLDIDVEALYQQFGSGLVEKVRRTLASHSDFVELGSYWFVKSLMAEINIGHLHLSEAVLEINEGGPMRVEEILPNLDLDPNVDPEVQRFSLNYALLKDDRFEDVGGRNRVAWFLKRLEPLEVRETPGRLVFRPVEYNRSSLSPQLRLLERELDDEWSDLKAPDGEEPALINLTFPHRWAGTLPISARVRPLLDSGRAPRQRLRLVDDEEGETIIAWAVHEGRYIYGLKEWYEKNEMPIGSFITLSPSGESDTLLLSYERRRPQREWVRLATVADNRIQFELKRRSIGSGYDDLMIVGTDVVAAIDALWRRAEANQRPLVSLLAEIFPSLAALTPQNTVHAKTLYSALNMLKRMPPGPIFAELVTNPAFQTVGDHYWMFDESRLQGRR